MEGQFPIAHNKNGDLEIALPFHCLKKTRFNNRIFALTLNQGIKGNFCFAASWSSTESPPPQFAMQLDLRQGKYVVEKCLM